MNPVTHAASVLNVDKNFIADIIHLCFTDSLHWPYSRFFFTQDTINKQDAAVCQSW